MASHGETNDSRVEVVDNIFEALGFENPEEEMVRCELISQIFNIGRELNLRDEELAERAGCSPQRMAQLRSIEFDDVTIDELCRYLVAIGHGVQIVVGPRVETGAHMTAVMQPKVRI